MRRADLVQLFEAPSNMIIKRMQPARYLAGLVLAWGLVATFSAFVNTMGALIACRLLLGLFEGETRHESYLHPNQN